jgi:hypothetical protein
MVELSKPIDLDDLQAPAVLAAVQRNIMALSRLRR